MALSNRSSKLKSEAARKGRMASPWVQASAFRTVVMTEPRSRSPAARSAAAVAAGRPLARVGLSAQAWRVSARVGASRRPATVCRVGSPDRTGTDSLQADKAGTSRRSARGGAAWAVPFDNVGDGVLAQPEFATNQAVAAPLGDQGEDLRRETIRFRPLSGLAAKTF